MQIAFNRWKIGLVGYGEVGCILAEDLRAQDLQVAAYDRRRAEELREVANTVHDAGLAPWLASGTAERQDWVADLADADAFGARTDHDFARNDWRTEADRLLATTTRN